MDYSSYANIQKTPGNIVFVGLEKRAPTRPLITKGNLVKSSCDSEYKLLVEK
jgi:hypothetical protein